MPLNSTRNFGSVFSKMSDRLWRMRVSNQPNPAETEPQPEPEPQLPPRPTASTTEEIFRRAIEQQSEVNQQAMLEMTRRNTEVFDHLKQMTGVHVMRQTLSGMHAVAYAAGLDQAFQARIVDEATDILQEHGVIPREEPDDTADAGDTDTGAASAEEAGPAPPPVQ